MCNVRPIWKNSYNRFFKKWVNETNQTNLGGYQTVGNGVLISTTIHTGNNQKIHLPMHYAFRCNHLRRVHVFIHGAWALFFKNFTLSQPMLL